LVVAESEIRMLGGFTKALRVRAACMLALIYGLCVLATAVAFALGDPVRALHCLTEDHHSVATIHADHDHGGSGHIHEDGAYHEHANHEDGDGKAPAAKCCGLACLSALPAGFSDLVSAPVMLASVLSPRQDSAAGRGPDLRYRPPISLLSL
jgi:hypothetical protein